MTKKEIRKSLTTERAKTETAISAVIAKSTAELRAISAARAKNCRKDCYPTMMIAHSGKIAQLRKYLSKIERAFENLENNKHGICRVCGYPIPAERLRSCPATDICVDCKTTLEVVTQTARKTFHHREVRAAAL